MKAKDIAIATFVIALAGILAYLWFSPSGLKQAPAIEVTTLEGKTVSLESLRGKPVLVTFWATTCPGCIKEMPHLVELYNELGPQGFEIIALAMSYDPEEQVREMVKLKQLPYTVALDSDGSASQAIAESCNDADDDCDGMVDEGVATAFYADADPEIDPDGGAGTVTNGHTTEEP